jgi:heptosyltransferase-2
VKIALIKTGALGDVVRTTSLVPALRRRFAGVEIVWITSIAAQPLASGHDRVRAVPIDDPPDAAWRHTRYDWVISLDDDLESCRVASALDCARLSGAYVDAHGNRAYTADLDAWFGMGLLRPLSLGGLAVSNQLKRVNDQTYGDLLFAGLGLEPPVDPPAVVLTTAARATAARWLDGHCLAGQAPIALNTGGGERWRYKSWGVDAAAALGRRLAATGWTVLVLGGRAEADRNAAICDRAAHPRVIAGPTDLDVLAFAALIAECAALVSSDSLAMHLAIAMSVPVTALFGPTSDAEIDLFGLGEKIVAPVPCVRCYLRTCDQTPNCMQAITPEIVFSRLPVTLGRAASASPLSATARK